MDCPYCGGTGSIDAKDAHCGMLIKIRREGRGLTQAELAGKMNISRAQLANIECGRTTDLQISKLLTASNALGCELRDLVP